MQLKTIIDLVFITYYFFNSLLIPNLTFTYEDLKLISLISEEIRWNLRTLTPLFTICLSWLFNYFVYSHIVKYKKIADYLTYTLFITLLISFFLPGFDIKQSFDPVTISIVSLYLLLIILLFLKEKYIDKK